MYMHTRTHLHKPPATSQASACDSNATPITAAQMSRAS